jgi:hypothetical protein
MKKHILFCGKLFSEELHPGNWFVLCIMAASLCLFGSAYPQTLSWDETIRLGNLDKSGLNALNATEYQYEIMGLAGTTLRVGPYGFTAESAPKVFAPGGTQYYPFFGYEYWWNNKSHRQQPFNIFGGYISVSHNIEVPVTGAINSFDHHLDIKTGILSIILGLEVEQASFTSRRDEFITPEGVWVVQVSDSGAVKPFILRLSQAKDMVDFVSYNMSCQLETQGMIITAVSPDASTAVMSVSWEGDASADTIDGYSIKGNSPNSTLTFYIAPASSYSTDGSDPVQRAWQLSENARINGYENEKQNTINWWNNFWEQHQVNLPSSETVLSKWYSRSLYYHGVFFGKTHIPPGLWGTSAFPGGGAVCPEFDLTFSQLAMLYTRHIDESANIVDWIKATLPQAQKNARSSTLYNVTIQHDWGAKYGWWVGYDGKYIIPGTQPEEINLYENYPSANCAVMAVKHADFTLDPYYNAFADTVVLQTTKVEVDDQVWSGTSYQDAHLPNNMQQASCLYGLTQCAARGIGDSAWIKMIPDILIPTGMWVRTTAPFRQKVLVGGPGAVPGSGGYYGDAPLLHALWWYDIIKKNDPLVGPTFNMVSLSNTASYVFNRGTMSVAASKLYDADNAYKWAVSLTASDVVYDDANISEMVHDVYDFQRTPEIAANGALICSLIEMLVDTDKNDPIEVFPAIPAGWWASGVDFKNILVKGGFSVSGKADAAGITVTIENINDIIKAASTRIYLPAGVITPAQYPAGSEIGSGYLTISDTLKANDFKTYKISFTSTDVNNKTGSLPGGFKLEQNFPNPFNPSTEIKYNIPAPGFVVLKVYDLLGKEIVTLVNRQQNPGSYSIRFNAQDLPSGLYIYKLQAGGFMSAKKMLLIK